MEFEALKPDKLMKLLTNNTQVLEGTISKNLENSGLNTGSPLNNLAVFLLAIIVAIVAVVIILVARKLLRNKVYKKKVEKLIVKQKKAFMWNNTIGSLSISYLKNCIAVSAFIQIQLMTSSQQEISVFDAIISVLLLTFLVSFIGISFHIARTKVTDLNEAGKEELEKKFGMFYARINFKKTAWSKYYFTVTFARKLLIVFIPLIFGADNVFPLQFGLLLSVIYTIMIAKLDAVVSKTEWKIELACEFLIIVQFYHLMMFTDFVQDLETQYNSGYSYIAVIAFLVVVNLIYIVWNMIKDLNRQRKMRAHKLVVL